MPYNLLSNIHEGILDINISISKKVHFISGNYDYYHYICDGFNDTGWGCGYRTLQTLCSWIKFNDSSCKRLVPTITEIQEQLVKVGDKSAAFIGSRQWIGSFEACVIIDQLYDIPCKILHINKGKDLLDNIYNIQEHFINFGSPIMMGGDLDCSSKGVIGVYVDGPKSLLLIVDPHFVGKAVSKEYLQRKGWVKWQPLEEFIDSSFYNLCMPQIKAADK